jgi:hypothetical protein
VAGGSGPAARRAATSLAALSGGTGLRYLEYTADVGGHEQLRAADEAAAVDRKAGRAAAANAAAKHQKAAGGRG